MSIIDHKSFPLDLLEGFSRWRWDHPRMFFLLVTFDHGLESTVEVQHVFIGGAQGEFHAHTLDGNVDVDALTT